MEAKRAAEAGLSAQYNGHPVSLEYLVLPDSSVALTYVVQVQGEDLDSWYEVFVDAHSRNILSTTDFVSHATVRIQTFVHDELKMIKTRFPSTSPSRWINPQQDQGKAPSTIHKISRHLPQGGMLMVP